MIKNLNEYLEQVNKIIPPNSYSSTTLPWFRGQSNEAWEIIPSIYRMSGTGKYEREMTRDFIMISENNKSYVESLETMVHMQHYGLPTRLIDWTESSLFALYFAVKNFQINTDAAVFIMHPWDLNKLTLPNLKGFNIGDITIPTSFDNRLSEYLIDIPSLKENVSIEFPIAFRPKRTNPRIRSQKGMFTIHGANPLGLEKIIFFLEKKYSAKIRFEKIIIAGPNKLAILRELYASGISHSMFFPEQEGICKEISFRYSREFTNKSSGHHFQGF